MANEYTKNYNLDLYTVDDRPNLLEQYNSAMNKIDEQLHKNTNAISHSKEKYCVLFGDSWLASYPYVENIIKQSNYYTKVFNFSVGGASASANIDGNKFSTQVDNATASTDFDNSDIDDVILVGGTNDVFYWSYWDDAVVQRSYNDFWPKLRSAFPKSNIHYFPDNARTMNGGYTYRYNWILESAQLNGICTHAKTLDMLALESINGEYIGDDQVGVQHLTKTGYTHLAKYILSTVQGAEPMLKSQTIYYSTTYPVNIGVVVMADNLPAELPEHPVTNQLLTYADGRFNLHFNLTLSSFKHLDNHALFIKTGPISHRIGANERPFYIDASRQPKIIAHEYTGVTGFVSTVEVNKAEAWDSSCSSYECFTPLVCTSQQYIENDSISMKVILPLTTLPQI